MALEFIGAATPIKNRSLALNDQDKLIAAQAAFASIAARDQGVAERAAEVDRYLALTLPIFSVIPEFQSVINEIEKAYVRGLYF